MLWTALVVLGVVGALLASRGAAAQFVEGVQQKRQFSLVQPDL
jgi:hypothetical protein